MNDTDRAEIDARATAIVRRALEAGLEGVLMTAFVDPECASANGYRNALTALDALETAAVETALAPQPASEAGRCGNCGHDHSAFARCTDCACVTWRTSEPSAAPPFVPDPGSSFADGGPEILDMLADIEKGVVAWAAPALPEIETVGWRWAITPPEGSRHHEQKIGFEEPVRDERYTTNPRALTPRTTAQAWKDAYERAENGAAKEQMRAITAERALAAATAEVAELREREDESGPFAWQRRAEAAERERDAIKLSNVSNVRLRDEAIAARDALAAELARIRAQEPVAWAMWHGENMLSCQQNPLYREHYRPLYALPPDSITRAEHEALRQRFENACGKITRLEAEHEAECLALFEGNATVMAAFSKQAASTHAAAVAAAHEAGAVAMRELAAKTCDEMADAAFGQALRFDETNCPQAADSCREEGDGQVAAARAIRALEEK